ncbi:15-hydroxyprostaglandin dehydrogenase [NAD(+)]-like [Schistocerca serialis cubense]|uniref:15-hydroxyprostaglandin dehydrogenase [NAD(+)]-like n=1 Tax=Schistocerca serialis cubense TaxID=2023355 RepID=UPI00214E74D5|nr:15-hydroxyprostaglandin dehydrogenase [NAD(+)]-like [Schistocerca serialis cubense]
MELRGCVALVTGGASGIGLQYARHLLLAGLKGVVLADLSEEAGAAATIDYLMVGWCFPEAFARAYDEFGRLDIVINNAGILNDAQWELQIDINVTAVVRCTQLAMELMSRGGGGGGGGVVLNVASVLGLAPLAGCPVYVATKHAVVGLSRSYGTQFHWQRTGVRVVALCPGVTHTQLIAQAGGRQPDPDQGALAVRELAALPQQWPEHVAAAALHVLRAAPNGSVWVAEGGEPAYQLRFPHRTQLRAAERPPAPGPREPLPPPPPAFLSTGLDRGGPGRWTLDDSSGQRARRGSTASCHRPARPVSLHFRQLLDTVPHRQLRWSFNK